jgi:hypothetical protein
MLSLALKEKNLIVVMTTGITHFKDNHFVQIHKVVDGSLCQKYLWHFGILAFFPI